jgi:hypothetical protein
MRKINSTGEEREEKLKVLFPGILIFNLQGSKLGHHI